jgi:hypothetical protein
MKLQLVFNENPDEETKSHILGLIFESALSDIRSGRSHWIDVICSLDLDGAQQVGFLGKDEPS